MALNCTDEKGRRYIQPDLGDRMYISPEHQFEYMKEKSNTNMKVRITNSDEGQLHKDYKEQLIELNIETKDIEIKDKYSNSGVRYNTLIENFTWDMLPKMMNMREPEWAVDKSRRRIERVVVSIPGQYDGEVDFRITLYDGYLE